MQTIDAIMSRRSIRKYSDRPVPDDQVTTLLKAAMAAPSAHNRQPGHFVVVRSRETLLGITKFHPYSKMLEHAPLAIVVCGDAELDGGTGFWVEDCSAATQNILLAARDAGLGAVWLGVYPMAPLVEGVKKLLGLPEKVTPLNIIPVGYPAEEKPPGNRFNEAKIHREKW